MTISYEDRQSRGLLTAKEAARRAGKSTRTAQRWTSQPRDQWLADKAREREEIRAYHDEGGHSWPETGKHFGLAEDTVKRRAYRARKERAAEREATEKGPTLFDADALPDAV